MKGIITALQRMSIHDGPGIRSTLFLKGCNLRCAWCHNPETWSKRIQLQYVAGKCIGCGTCLHACGRKAIRAKEKIVLERDRCNACGACVERCLTGALSWVGREMDPAEAVRELSLDKAFYRTSGGGVTLSGGEPLLQSQFVREVLRGCLAEGIHTAVESNLTEEWEVVRTFLPLVKLWMCDLKLADSELHRRWTGQGNERILDNLRRLANEGVRLIVRTPVVPGVNDSEEAIESLCRIVGGLGGNVAYELLGFHPLGFGKFDDLGMTNPMPGIAALDTHRLARLKTILPHYGLKSQL